MANSREATVKILTDPPGILTPSIIGVEMAVQAVEAEVTEANGPVVRYLLVGAYFPQLDVRICDEIARNLAPHFKGVEIYFTTSESEGEAEVYGPAEQQSPDPFLIAAAVAVLKTSWGLEEANPMAITIAGETVRVVLIYNGNSWLATLANAP